MSSPGDLTTHAQWVQERIPSVSDLPAGLLNAAAMDVPGQVVMDGLVKLGDNRDLGSVVRDLGSGYVVTPKYSLRLRSKRPLRFAGDVAVVTSLWATVSLVAWPLSGTLGVLALGAVVSSALVAWSFLLRRKASKSGERLYERPDGLLPQHELLLCSMGRRVWADVFASKAEESWEDYWDVADLVKQRDVLRRSDPEGVLPEITEAVMHLDSEIFRILSLYPASRDPEAEEKSTPKVSTPDLGAARVLAETITMEASARRTLRE